MEKIKNICMRIDLDLGAELGFALTLIAGVCGFFIGAANMIGWFWLSIPFVVLFSACAAALTILSFLGIFRISLYFLGKLKGLT